MGLGCPNALSAHHRHSSLPVLNMVVLGFPASGKSMLIQRLGVQRDEKEERETQECSVERVQLEIGSFVLEKRVKVVAFEVPSAAVKTWRYYYVNAHILLFVIDHHKLHSNSPPKASDIIAVLREIDRTAPSSCQLIVVFSKCQLPVGEGEQGQYTSIVKALGEFSHEAVTIKYSAVSGEGVDRISQSALGFHKNIHL